MKSINQFLNSKSWRKLRFFTLSYFWFFVTTAITLFLTFVTTAINWYFEKFGYSLPDNRGDWGVFGDFIGGLLNPIFAFLSFLALLYTIHLQSKELKESREFQQKERFENTFFILLEHLNKVGIPSDKIKNIKDTIGSSELEEANKLLKDKNDIVAHYFRTLFQLLKFVYTDCPLQKNNDKKRNWKEFEKQAANTDNQSTPNEKFYSNIVRASLFNDLMFLLAINCYCFKEKVGNSEDKHGYWEYKLLVERYQFLEHLSLDDATILELDILNHYDRYAFGCNYEKSLNNFKNELEKIVKTLSENLKYYPDGNDIINSTLFKGKIKETIESCRREIKKLRINPDLENYLHEIKSNQKIFPSDYPFTFEQVLDDSFFP